MILFKKVESLKQFLNTQRQSGLSIGFVPTMGALHDGHRSLIDSSKLKCDITVCSIFINPTQFNDPTDFKNYPQTLPADILMLEKLRCNVLFIPSVAEMYPSGLNNNDQWSFGDLENIWEGQHRRGHFKGVTQIVSRLLKSVEPTMIFLGEKDAQQVLIIKKLIAALNINVAVCIVPTLREPSGLAMSSRNQRLTDEQKVKASTVYKSFKNIEANYRVQDFAVLEDECRTFLLSNGIDSIDYLKIVNAANLQPVRHWDGNTDLMVIAAVTVGGVRLIDNLYLVNTPL